MTAHLLTVPVRDSLLRPTEHFSWAEVEASATASARGIVNRLPAELEPVALYTALRMEEIRSLLRVPLVITSWYRSPPLNRAVGSGSTSAHLLAGAVDWVPGEGMSLQAAYDQVADSGLPFDQLIIERASNGAEWIHTGWIRHPRRSTLVASWNAALRKMTFRQRTAAG